MMRKLKNLKIIFILFLFSCSVQVKHADISLWHGNEVTVHDIKEINEQDQKANDAFNETKKTNDIFNETNEEETKKLPNLCPDGPFSPYDYDGDNKGDLCDSCPFADQNISGCLNMNNIKFLNGDWYLSTIGNNEVSTYVNNSVISLQQKDGSDSIYIIDSKKDQILQLLPQRRLKLTLKLPDKDGKIQTYDFEGFLISPGDKMIFQLVTNNKIPFKLLIIMQRMAKTNDMKDGFYPQNLLTHEGDNYLMTGLLAIDKKNDRDSNGSMYYTFLNSAILKNSAFVIQSLQTENETSTLKLYNLNGYKEITLKQNKLPIEAKVDNKGLYNFSISIPIEKSNLPNSLMSSNVTLYPKGMFSYFGDVGVFVGSQPVSDSNATAYDASVFLIFWKVIADKNSDFIESYYKKMLNFGVQNFIPDSKILMRSQYDLNNKKGYSLLYDLNKAIGNIKYCRKSLNKTSIDFINLEHILIEDLCVKSLVSDNVSIGSSSGILAFPLTSGQDQYILPDSPAILFYIPDIPNNGFETMDDFSPTPGISFAFIPRFGEIPDKEIDPDCDGVTNDTFKCDETVIDDQDPDTCLCLPTSFSGDDNCPCRINLEGENQCSIISPQ